MTFARFLAFGLVLLASATAGAAPLKQVYKKPQPIQPGSYDDPYYGRQGGRICARWCLQDRNPCDPPDFKIADGRCLDDWQ
jgi:hypothetical protein